MFRPKYPTAPTPTGVSYPTVIDTMAKLQQPHSGSCACTGNSLPPESRRDRPTVRLSPAAIGGGVAVVLVVGAVLVSMLLAVAVTACAVTVCALVLRSLLASEERRRY